MSRAETAARANRHGDPCPPWCVADHLTPGPAGAYTDAHQSVGFWIAAGPGVLDDLTVRAWETDAAPCVRVAGLRAAGPAFRVHPGAAEDLALLLDQLAAATADQHRSLAAAIRSVRSVITAVRS